MKKVIKTLGVIFMVVVCGWVAYLISGLLTSNPITRALISGFIFLVAYGITLIVSLVLLWLVLETVRKMNENGK
jgi:hypothetical protein